MYVETFGRNKEIMIGGIEIHEKYRLVNLKFTIPIELFLEYMQTPSGFDGRIISWKFSEHAIPRDKFNVNMVLNISQDMGNILDILSTPKGKLSRELALMLNVLDNCLYTGIRIQNNL
jgi:hypothetical protein